MHNKTKQWQSIKPLIPLTLVAILLMVLGSLPVDSTHAQGGPEPTPTDIGSGGGSDDDDDDGDSDDPGPPPPSVAGISGFVYDYSGAVYEGGITVIFETEGWQTEAVTDSNGFYHIRGLDTNSGILNLQLPPGVTAAAPDWPVRLVRGGDTEVNLGYYWRDGSSIPVRLTATLNGSQLLVEVDNQTSEAATGGEIRVLSPPVIRVSTPLQTNGATISDYNPNHFQLDVSELGAGETLAVTLPAEANLEVEAGQAAPEIRVTFTYDQQITPQVIVLNAESLPNIPLAALESSQSRSAVQVSDENTITLSSSESAQPASSSSEASATTADTTDDLASAFEPTTADESNEAQSEAVNNFTEKEEMLPVTGRISEPVNSVAFIVLAVLLILGLATGGLWALRTQQPN